MTQNRQQPRKRGPGRPFEPGNRANPGGRPKAVADVREAAKQHTQAAITALVQALDDPKAKVAAATALLDRAWGRPAQHVEVDGTLSLGIAAALEAMRARRNT